MHTEVKSPEDLALTPIFANSSESSPSIAFKPKPEPDPRGRFYDAVSNAGDTMVYWQEQCLRDDGPGKDSPFYQRLTSVLNVYQPLFTMGSNAVEDSGDMGSLSQQDAHNEIISAATALRSAASWIDFRADSDRDLSEILHVAELLLPSNMPVPAETTFQLQADAAVYRAHHATVLALKAMTHATFHHWHRESRAQ